MTIAYLVNYPPMMPTKVYRYDSVDEAEQAAAKREKCKVVTKAEDLRDLGGPVLVTVFNSVSPKLVKRFATLDDAVNRSWRAIEDHFGGIAAKAAEHTAQQQAQAAEAATKPGEISNPTDEENTDMPNTTKKATKSAGNGEKKPRGTKMISGKPAGRVADFKQVRAGTDRAIVLKMMDGKHTTASIAKAIEDTEQKVLAHAYCLARDCAIGYKLNDEGKLEALYPGNKSFADAIKPPAEKKEVKKAA